MSDPAAPDPRTTSANITEILQSAYIDYSMSVIVSRALPDARDGLKPVQRRILYAMLREGLLHNRPFEKCASVVGEVLKNYHPHGDSSVYETLVRLAQPWVMRYPLLEPQGNFGSVDGDRPAAYRYTESRLTELAEELLRDIEEETVDFSPNYKESTTEPVVLPAALPNLLMNGAVGIAVGMATNIPPHHLGEIVQAICAVLDNPQIPLEELVRLVPGPDFPTGGMIVGRQGIDSYLRTGRGSVRMRGTVTVETADKGEREQIVITEIPYNVNRATLVTQIADLVRNKEITGIAEIRDESDDQTRIVIEPKRGENTDTITNQLYERTALQTTFNVNLLALDRRRPRQMNLRELIDCYVAHRREVLVRRCRHRLRKAEERAHVLEGYKIALDNLDEFVRIIRASANREEAHAGLLERFPLSEAQATAILELRLYQLTGLEREKIEEEYQELLRTLGELQSILQSERLLLELVRKELVETASRYAGPRRTRIIDDPGEFRPEDLIPNVPCIVTISHHGFIKRTPLEEYRVQRRGGRGVLAADAHTDDFIQRLFTANTHDYVLFLTGKGQAIAKKVHEIPEAPRIAKGRALASVIELPQNDAIAAVICFESFAEDRFLVLATRAGLVKKTRLCEYAHSVHRGGVIGIRLKPDDAVVGGVLTSGTDEMILVSHQGLAVRFSEGPEEVEPAHEPTAAEAQNDADRLSELTDPAEDASVGEPTDGPREGLRATGRATSGVTGMRFKREGDFLEVIEVVDHEARFLVASEAGRGMRTRFEDYRLTRRGGTGVWAIDLPEDGSVNLAGALSVRDHDEIMLLTARGQSVRCPVKDIRETDRGARGVRLINLEEGDRLLSVARVADALPQDSQAEQAAPHEPPTS